MNQKRMAAICLLLLMLPGCNHLAVKTEQCETSIRAYNRMMRWQEYDSAEKAVEQAVRAEFRRRLAEKEFRIADYRIKSMSCDAEKGEADVLLEYDYYLPPSTTLKTIKDHQKWQYSPEHDPGGWRITTPPPDFFK